MLCAKYGQLTKAHTVLLNKAGVNKPLFFLKLLALEIVLVCAAGSSLIWNYIGVFFSGVIVSAINLVINPAQDFWFWESVIILYMALGLAANALLNRQTHDFRLIKVISGSGSSFIVLGIFIPFIPAALLWAIFIGIPLIFSYRSVSRFVVIQLFFRFIFSFGWLIIGNIL